MALFPLPLRKQKLISSGSYSSAAVTCVLVTWILVGCARVPVPIREVRGRVPGKIADAIVVQSDVDALSDFMWELYVVPHGAPYTSAAAPSLTVEHSVTYDGRPGLQVRWRDAHTVIATFGGRVQQFTNYSGDNDDPKLVHVVLNDIGKEPYPKPRP